MLKNSVIVVSCTYNSSAYVLVQYVHCLAQVHNMDVLYTTGG